MIFIGGISQGEKQLNYTQTVICDICGRYGRYQVFMTYMYFSFFFIPLFKWNKRFYVKMSCCGSVYELDPEIGKEILAGRQVEIRYASDQYAKDSFAQPETGRMPEAEYEIALDTLTLQRLGVTPELGASVTLEWQKDITSPEMTSSTFTLCGFWEGNASSYASMAWVSKEFALEACGRSGSRHPHDGRHIC